MNSLSQMIQNIFSDNSNIMLAAIISLLLVILFVLLLHLYAKWFLFQAQVQARARRRRRRHHRITTVTVSDVFGPARFHHFHSFNIQDSPLSSSHTKGLDSSIISAIPMFMYKASEAQEQGDDYYDDAGDNKVEQELECVICLSAFEDGEMGKCLPKCGHGFHVECIDMWLSSHSNCPICRAPIVALVGDDSSALVEIVVDDAIATPSSHEIRDNDDVGVSESVSEASLFLFRFSLKRILSKVFHSSYINELQF
ncbi:hypothetical protein Lal_00028271 [Lupinus albus]|uniref:RING-type E3 ubiquitin transferase n=1 Tax=Lupinus albus TaxID=3870 RepID=A0A6A4P9E7_LUPAL|nr:putative chromatin regulator PHD family [Lupinus albus]KAF1894827.1 hypothetical protein Lal_00028271 [Lupinus albus]